MNSCTKKSWSKVPSQAFWAISKLAEATHVSSTELLFNWLPLLGATEWEAQGCEFCWDSGSTNKGHLRLKIMHGSLFNIIYTCKKMSQHIPIDPPPYIWRSIYFPRFTNIRRGLDPCQDRFHGFLHLEGLRALDGRRPWRWKSPWVLMKHHGHVENDVHHRNDLFF